MSIIHDALKKVQASLSKSQTPAPTPDSTGATPGITPAAHEPPPIIAEEQTEKLASGKKTWQTVLIAVVAALVTFGALYYIWDNYELDLNKIPGLAAMRRTISNATHKAPEPKPLAQVTITASQMQGSGPQGTAASTATGNAAFTDNSATAAQPTDSAAANANASATSPTPQAATSSSPAQGISAAIAKLVAPKPADNNNSTTLNIQGVMDGGKSKVALINDKIYEEGDEISGVKILSISVDAITILKDGKEEKIVVRHYGK